MLTRTEKLKYYNLDWPQLEEDHTGELMRDIDEQLYLIDKSVEDVEKSFAPGMVGQSKGRVLAEVCGKFLVDEIFHECVCSKNNDEMRQELTDISFAFFQLALKSATHHLKVYLNKPAGEPQ